MTDLVAQEWEAAWRARLDRRLLAGCKIDVSADWPHAVVSVTISASPQEFADRVWCGSEVCPVCGDQTVGLPRLKAMLDVHYADGFGVLVGAWAHDKCLNACPVIGPAAHIPW
jgi:hypothetical protein